MKIFFLVLSLSASALHARWMTIEEAGSVIENYSIEYKINRNGASTQTVDYTVRVQAEDAKVSASLFPIDYNAFTDKVEILEAFTLNGKNKIPVEAAAIEDRDKGEAKDYDAMKVRSVVFPKVQIGSRLHIRYLVRTEKPLMENRWSTDISLAPGAFVEKLRVNVQSEVPIYFRAEDPRRLVAIQQKNKFSFELTNKKTLPGWVHAEKDPYFHPSGFTRVWISTHQEWMEFFADLDKEFEGIVAAPLPLILKPWVNQARVLKDPKAQILFLMDRMSREFRYFGDWRRHKGGIVPRALSEIEKSRYGDCKDLASLLTAMLRNLKIEANVVLVRRGENAWGAEPDYPLPDMNRFNHAIVQAKVGKEVLWLDATNPVASLKPFTDISGRPAWILQPGHGHFERLPPAQSQDFVHLHDYQYSFQTMDMVKVKVDAQLKGLASFHIANELLMVPRSEVLTETLDYFSEGQEVRSFHYLKEPQTTRALLDMQVALVYDAGRVTFDAGKAAFFVIPDGFLTGSFYETENRESDLRLAAEPFVFKGARKLKDTKLMQVAPDRCRVESEWMDLDREVRVEGKDVVIYQNVDLKKPFVTHTEYKTPAFRKLQAGTKKCFYRSGILIESLNGAL